MKRIDLFIVLGSLAIVVGLAGITIICVVYYAVETAKTEYGVVFDAGSSHTSMFVYKWKSSKVNGTGEVKQIKLCRIEDPISSFADNPANAGESLKSCLTEAGKAVPLLQIPFTPIYFGATAGMRLLREKNSNQSDAIIKSVRKVIQDSGFMIRNVEKQVRIITGEEEGVGVWISTNYMTGSLEQQQSSKVMHTPWWRSLTQENSIGVMDMGGASTQIAFSVDNVTGLPPDAKYKVKLYGDKLTLFSDTFLCYGAGEFRKRLLASLVKAKSFKGPVEHPCLANNYSTNMTIRSIFASPCTEPFRPTFFSFSTTIEIRGTGDNNQCGAETRKLYNESSCTFDECSFNGHSFTDLPSLLLAKGSFYYTVNDLNVVSSNGTVKKADYIEAMKAFCEKNHESIKNLQLYDPLQVCPTAHHVYTLLNYGYRLRDSDWPNIKFTNEINDTDIGWTLGYMTNATATLPSTPELTLYNISLVSLGLALAISSAVLLLGIVSVVCSCVRKRRRRQHEQLLGGAF